MPGIASRAAAVGDRCGPHVRTAHHARGTRRRAPSGYEPHEPEKLIIYVRILKVDNLSAYTRRYTTLVWILEVPACLRMRPHHRSSRRVGTNPESSSACVPASFARRALSIVSRLQAPIWYLAHKKSPTQGPYSRGPMRRALLWSSGVGNFI